MLVLCTISTKRKASFRSRTHITACIVHYRRTTV